MCRSEVCFLTSVFFLLLWLLACAAGLLSACPTQRVTPPRPERLQTLPGSGPLTCARQRAAEWSWTEFKTPRWALTQLKARPVKHGVVDTKQSIGPAADVISGRRCCLCPIYHAALHGLVRGESDISLHAVYNPTRSPDVWGRVAKGLAFLRPKGLTHKGILSPGFPSGMGLILDAGFQEDKHWCL
ncbi:uncharacterized protein VTP21DRAFT_1040 [Calcarisporiella thermophila]|uniref:uncharacterized protein n=1 Tax=Calcarisporiella thermophila TaxID=911321 RepID=UPI003742CC5B